MPSIAPSLRTTTTAILLALAVSAPSAASVVPVTVSDSYSFENFSISSGLV